VARPNYDVAERLFEAFAKRDVDALLELALRRVPT
jgi:hypothetical protein